MKLLKEKDAERCARACGWTFHEDIRDHGTWGRLLAPACWKDAEGKWVPHTCVITNCGYDDSYFWRPRLEDRLEEIEPGLIICAIEMADRKWYWFVTRRISGFPDTLEQSHIARSEIRCLALCEAIETLEERTNESE